MVTTKLRKVEIEAVLARERAESEVREKSEREVKIVVSDEVIARFERRERRETVPAPVGPVDEDEGGETDEGKKGLQG
jgi:hypothetical protein